MKFELIFIRHGESTGNVEQITRSKDKDFAIELTDTGKGQAKATKEAIQNELFDAVFASDMMRTRQTAEIIFGDRYDITFDPRIREYYTSPDDEYTVPYDIPREHHVELRLSGFQGGESFAQQVDRVREFLSMLLTGEYGQKIAVVTHVGCLRALEVIFNGVGLEEALWLPKPANASAKRLFVIKDENGVQLSDNSLPKA